MCKEICNLCLEAEKFRCHLGNADLRNNFGNCSIKIVLWVGGFLKILRNFQSGS